MKISKLIREIFSLLVSAYLITIAVMLCCDVQFTSLFIYIHLILCFIYTAAIPTWLYIEETIKNKWLRQENLRLLARKLNNEYLAEYNSNLRFELKSLTDHVKELEKIIKNQSISIGMYKRNSRKSKEQIKALQSNKNSEVADEQ